MRKAWPSLKAAAVPSSSAKNQHTATPRDQPLDGNEQRRTIQLLGWQTSSFVTYTSNVSALLFSKVNRTNGLTSSVRSHRRLPQRVPAASYFHFTFSNGHMKTLGLIEELRVLLLNKSSKFRIPVFLKARTTLNRAAGHTSESGKQNGGLVTNPPK